MDLAIVGVTGMVGRVLLRVLEERDFPVDNLIPVASERSRGKELEFKGTSYPVHGLEEALEMGPELVIFSAGSQVAREWASAFVDRGATVIDNSSAFRMDEGIPLVVPEINGDRIGPDGGIIANPNCSTIQFVMALAPIHAEYGVDRAVVSTYQSVTGSGQKALDQLMGERKGEAPEMAYPFPIDLNCIPHCGDFDETGYNEEERKLMTEPMKILGDASLRLTATAVRVPVKGGHSESINLELKREFDIGDLQILLSHVPGIKLQDNPDMKQYPMPLHAEGNDEVFVGRLRRDTTKDNALDMWVVADNLRKGAATNAVRIAELVLEKRG
ncbi:MAG: aspartate-semialdehyde dehydrogenase [Flavobacteriales bacterium]